MNDPLNAPHALFEGHQLLARGPLQQVVAEAVARGGVGADGRPLLLLNDGSGETVDLGLRGGLARVLERLRARLAPAPAAPQEAAAPRERGRPRLGVVAREVTLLPRHWEWLASQRGGASQALRRLVDEARRREQEHARHLSLHDVLTDLPNQRLLQDRLFVALNAARRSRETVAVVFVDLDNFKGFPGFKRNSGTRFHAFSPY